MSTVTSSEIETILNDVQAKLDVRRASTGLALQVVPDASRKDDDWLVIVVAPAKAGVRAYDYVQALSDVERELREAGMAKVLLVPAVGD